MTARPLTRRAAIGGAALLAAAPTALRASAHKAVRLAAIDWAMLETAAMIGHMPAAACELLRYRLDAVAPRIPAEVVDLGLRGAPNIELLQLVRPALILSSPYYAGNEARFRAIAPVLSLSFFEPGVPPLPRALAALGILAGAVGDPAAGARAQAQADARLDALGRRLIAAAGRPVAIISIGDARHMRVFGLDSLFGSTLARLGLANAWTEGTRFSFLAPVPIEALAGLPEARLVIMGQVPPEARSGLDRSVLWRRLPQVAAGRVHQLPEVNAFGGAPAALRFAEALARALVPA